MAASDAMLLLYAGVAEAARLNALASASDVLKS
jgi:hypothetical protein